MKTPTKRGPEPSKTRKCKKCKNQVKKTNFEVLKNGKLSYACNSCRKLGMPKITTKKTKEVEKFRINSHEEKQSIRLSAAEALAKAKAKEAELIKNGARYIQASGIRMFILSM